MQFDSLIEWFQHFPGENTYRIWMAIVDPNESVHRKSVIEHFIIGQNTNLIPHFKIIYNNNTKNHFSFNLIKIIE